jgi:hypothetical protein
MKREYPLFLIDRSKPPACPFDFVACFDRTCGFVARVFPFFQDAPLNEFIKQREKVKDAEYTSVMFRFKREGGVILAIEDFLYDFEWTAETKTRVRTLLKKAMKKYLHAEIDRSPSGDFGINEQIKQQKESIERAKANYVDLLKRANGNKELADYTILLAEATLETLIKFRDNRKFIFVN